jgi:photosystem II stability/assembly factor-like uncharacterized protein
MGLYMRKNIGFGLVFLTLGISLHAQQKPVVNAVTNTSQILDVNKQFKNLKPRCIGPSGMSGRITTIDALWDNPNTMYLGAASGGVWKTENAGNDWKPIFDEQPIQNIGSIAIQQSNPSVLWVGTGEGNPRNSVNIGEGIYKSLDAGKTWKCMGLEATRNIHRIIIDPTNPNIVYAGAIGNPYGVHSQRGVFKTTDGGETWNKILYTNDTSGIGDMIMDPTNPNKIYAAMWQHSRTPWSLNSGGKGSGFYVTIDGGKNWKKLGKEEGLPTGDYGRIGLSICRSMPNRVYALIESTKSGLYKSDDGGSKWELVNSDPAYVANRSFYFQDIIADPLNENRLWLINQIVSMSEDGGKTFKTVIPYNGIHPDHHAFWIHPKDNKFIIDGNDGGIGITRDMGKNWMFDEKIPVGQFYHINVDNETPYNVMGGMQDNGSWRGPAYTWTSGGLKNYYWESLWGGDGFDVMPDAEDANWIYAMSQGGNVGRYNVVTGEDWTIVPPSVAIDDEKTRIRFNWNAAIAQDPFDKKTIYYGSQFIHKSTNKGASWSTISPDLSTNDSIKQDQSKNGGISIDITGAENHCTVITIAPSKLKAGLLWAGTDDGQIQLTQNGGGSWTNITKNITGLPKGSWVPQIQASRYNASEAFVVANNYRQGDFAPYIFRTQDYGKTWTKLVDDKKVKGYALCVLQDPAEPNLIFVGTEQGLYVSLNNGDNFQQFKNGYPSVSTYDMAIQEREADLCIATFGRAIYILDDINPLRAAAKNKGQLQKTINLFTANDAYQANYKNAPGYEWSTWGIWDATNKPRGAGIAYFANKPLKLDSLQKKSGFNMDTAVVKIYNNSNEEIRSLKWLVDSGYNKRYWGMNQKGVRYPGSPKPKPNADEPGGDQVEPGTYKVVMQYLGKKDSTMVTIKADPRVADNVAILRSQKALIKKLETSTNRLTLGMDALTDAEETAKKIEGQLKDLEDKSLDSLRKQTKKMQDEIKNIRDFISGKKVERQGYGQLPQTTVMTTLQEAQRNIRGKNAAPSAQEEKLVAKAEKKINDAMDKINNFFAKPWAGYKSLYEASKINVFKEVKTF